MAGRFSLLVEGQDDKAVISRLLERHSLQANLIDIKVKHGYNGLLESLPVHLKESELERLGIVVDADRDPGARWQSLTEALRRAGYRRVPRRPRPDGTVIVDVTLPVVGLWLMPNNQTRGMLEDFVAFMIPQGDRLWELAETCIRQVVDTEQRFPETQVVKARLYTWLAWQEEPGTRPAAAIMKRYLEADAVGARQFLRWLSELFPGLVP